MPCTSLDARAPWSGSSSAFAIRSEGSRITWQVADDAPYDLQRLKTPVLGGWLLSVFVWIAESWLFNIIGPKLMRDSGIPQVSSAAATATPQG